MNKSNIHGDQDKRNVNPDWFTAKTWMKVLSEKIQSPEHDIYHVHFEDGSRTKLHVHNGHQILIATGGSGSLEIFQRIGGHTDIFDIQLVQKMDLQNGDIVHIPKDTLHTHGSTDSDEPFTHIAINVLPNNNYNTNANNSQYETIWYESDFESKVTKRI